MSSYHIRSEMMYKQYVRRSTSTYVQVYVASRSYIARMYEVRSRLEVPYKLTYIRLWPELVRIGPFLYSLSYYIRSQ